MFQEGVVALGSIKILKRLELVSHFEDVETLPQFLHNTLTSVSSPHFWEFSLHLLRGSGNDGDPGPRTFSWGAGWEIVDEDLYTYAARRGNFRFVIEIPPGASTEAAIAALFPRMKSKGWLVIKWQWHPDSWDS